MLTEPPLYEDSVSNNDRSPTTNDDSKKPQSKTSCGNSENLGEFIQPSKTLFVKPTSVNISQANPANLHPQYPEYLEREQIRTKNGDFPRDRSQFKHGAPLNPGHTGAGVSSKAFPGSSRATYHDVANR